MPVAYGCHHSKYDIGKMISIKILDLNKLHLNKANIAQTAFKKFYHLLVNFDSNKTTFG